MYSHASGHTTVLRLTDDGTRLFPVVTSLRYAPLCDQIPAGCERAAAFSAIAKTPAISGDETLVPPYAPQPPLGKLSYTATGVSGSATADMLVSERIVQPLSVCQTGLATSLLHPLPVPPLSLLRVMTSFHTLSLQPRVVEVLTSRVPPTATTFA